MGRYPAQYFEYFDLFNAERFWHSHEALEELWRENGDRFLQGLILFAAAFVHVQKNNPSGCRKVMEKAVQWLEPYAPHRWGLDVTRILTHARHCLELLERRPEGQELMGYIPLIKLNPQD